VFLILGLEVSAKRKKGLVGFGGFSHCFGFLIDGKIRMWVMEWVQVLGLL